MLQALQVLMLGLLLAPRPPQPAAPMLARLELAAGDVQVDGQAALSGAALLANARVKTGEGARALVRLSDGAALFLRGGTTVEIGSDQVRLLSGELWLDAPPSERGELSYRVGDALVHAVEAGLSMRHTGDGARLYVARGLATLTSAGGRAEVHAGEAASALGQARPKVEAVAFWEDWTGGMADHPILGSLAGEGSGQLFGVDRQAPAGAPALRLEIARQAVRVVIRAGLAETEVDQTFFNPSARPVEGWYWFRVPEGASVTGFAVETNGALVEGELIERQEAAAQYERATGSGHAPALLEWVDGRTFRSRIFPVPAVGGRRVVLRYLQLLPDHGGQLRYLYPLQAAEPVRIGEFSLSVDLGEEGRGMQLTTLADARVEDGGRRVSMRRSGYVPRCDFQLEARLGGKRAPLKLLRFSAGGDAADYVMARYVPDVEWHKVKQPRGEIVLVVDTSAGGDDSTRALRAATAQAILRALSADDRFALVALDVRPSVLYPAEGLAAAGEDSVAAALKRLAEHPGGGATDLSAFFDVALERLHGGEQPAVIYVGDGLPTSGELGNAALIGQLRRALATSRARLFTVAAGPQANRALLEALAAAGGGQAFQVNEPRAATERALRLVAELKTPTLTDFQLDLGAGLDEAFDNVRGKLKSGDEVVVLARTHHDLPARVRVRGRLGGQEFRREYPAVWDRSLAAAFVPRLWAAAHIRRLLGSAEEPEAVRGKVLQLGMEYGLLTPFTSFLALESEAAYHAMGIQRRHRPLRGLRLADLDRRPPAAPKRPLVMAATPVAGGLGLAADDRLAMADAPRPGSMQAKAARARPAMEEAESVREEPAPAPAAPARAPEARAPVHGDAAAAPVAPDSRLAQALQVCSDTSGRPLYERVLVWRRRVATARTPQELVGRFQSARQACELPDWFAESVFLQLIQPRILDEGAARYVLSSFRHEPETQRYLARLILRQIVDPRVIAVVEGVLFGDQVNWATVDGELAQIADPAQRLARLRQVVARVPDDPNGLIRMVRLLVRARQLDEALLQGRRLRDAGLTTPFLARELGDVLAAQRLTDEAVRTYSEIVEFDPRNTRSRLLLGDVYLAHGWYEPAYRQYRTLTEQAPAEALYWLRLAAAAAGAGRVDEALRLERQVATSAGRPGPTDPRRFAELQSAARLARLLAAPPSGAGEPARVAEGIRTRLKELQLFRGPGSLVVVTWEDLGADLRLATVKAGAEVGVGQAVDGAAVGLACLLLAPGDRAGVGLRLFLRSPAAERPIALKRHEIRWDGKELQVSVKDLSLPVGATGLDL